MIFGFAVWVMLASCCYGLPGERRPLLQRLELHQAQLWERSKRTLSPIQIGATALKLLLKGTEKLGMSGLYRHYKKTGSFRTALRDFRSVKPTSVRRMDLSNGVRAIEGTIGDRKIFIHNGSLDGKPVLEIVEMNPGKGQQRIIDRIEYDNELMKHDI